MLLLYLILACNVIPNFINIDYILSVISTTIFYVLTIPIIYTVTVVVVPAGVPSAPIQIPYIGTVFQSNMFENREPYLFNWKLPGKAASYYNVVTSPDLWYLQAVWIRINTLNNIVVTKVSDNDNDEFEKSQNAKNNDKIESLLMICKDIATSEENGQYSDTTMKGQSPVSYFTLSHWVYTDLLALFGTSRTISYENIVGKH